MKHPDHTNDWIVVEVERVNEQVLDGHSKKKVRREYQFVNSTRSEMWPLRKALLIGEKLEPPEWAIEAELPPGLGTTINEDFDNLQALADDNQEP